MTATQPKSRQLLGINQQTYQALRASISLDLRRQLLIAVCDSVEMQEQIAAQLEQDVKQQIKDEGAVNSSNQTATDQAVKSAMLTKPMDRLVFDADDGNLPQQIANWMRHTLFTIGDLPRLQVLGIEQMTRQPAITQNYFLRSLDKIEALLPQLNTSLLVWVPWPWLRTIQQSSSTFWNWRNGVFEFVSDPTPTPAKREALDIDVSMFEPERQSPSQQAANSAISKSAGSKSAVLNGSGDRPTASKAAQNDQSQHERQSSASKTTTKSPRSTPSNSKPPNSIQSVDLSNFFDIQKTTPTQGINESEQPDADWPDADNTNANETVADAAAVDQVGRVPASLSDRATGNKTPDAEEATKTEPMPLEFWDDDDFPIFDSDLAFDSDIESAAAKLDEAENERSDSEAHPDPEPIDSRQLQIDSAPADGGQAEDAQVRNIEQTVDVVKDAASAETISELVGEGEETAQASQQLETDQEVSDVEAAISSPTQAASPEKAADQENVATKQKKKRWRNLGALGGLHSVVSQGINVSSSRGAATEARPEHSEKTASEENPAALLDALSKQTEQTVDRSKPPAVDKAAIDKAATDKTAVDKTAVEKAPTQYTATEIPVLKNADSSSEHSIQTAVSKRSPIEEQSTPDEQNSRLAGSAVQVVERRLTVSEETESRFDRKTMEERAPVDSETSQLRLAKDALSEDALSEDALSEDAVSAQTSLAEDLIGDELIAAQQSEDTQGQAAQCFTEGLAYRSRIEAGEKDLTVIEPAIAAYEKGLGYLRDSHPDRITGLNDLGTLYWLKAQRQSEKAQAIACMKKSIQLYREALGNSSNLSADDSAQLNIIGQLHSNMGAVFTMLATCEDPVSNLMQAAESYQQALPMVPLNQNPEEYATLYNSLGSVYWKLSHYESVELYLHQAIAAYTEALLGYSPEQQPLDYAAVQNNLGITYWSLAKHEAPETLLKRAIASYRDALNYRTSDVDPAACAISYNNLALAYWDLSKHTHSDLAQKSRYQKNAITAFEAALNINNLSGALSPMDSAAIYHCLGDVHAQMTETAPSTIDIADSLQKSLYSYVKSIENLSTDSPAYPPRFGAIIANLRLHYDKLGLEGQQNALNRIPSTLLPQVMMAL